jgi:hypothetical protein
MNPRTVTFVFVVAVLAVVGCTLNKSELRRDNFLKIGGGGRLIEPKRCALQVAFLSCPLRDAALNTEIWNAADEQVIAPEVRRALEVNGLRIGLIAGTLPAEAEAMLNAPPSDAEPKKSQIILPDGSNTLMSLVESTPQVSLLLNRDNHASGKDYDDASGWFRVTATQEGPAGVALRFVPEIHHGPLQRAFGAVPNTGAYAPQGFMVKDGQEEETFRELAASLTLQPGQVAVLGCRPENPRSLGAFLFTQPEPNSDRLLQRVLLIWASRSSEGLPTLEPVDPPDMPQSSRQKAEDQDKDRDKKENHAPKPKEDPPAQG